MIIVEERGRSSAAPPHVQQHKWTSTGDQYFLTNLVRQIDDENIANIWRIFQKCLWSILI